MNRAFKLFRGSFMIFAPFMVILLRLALDPDGGLGWKIDTPGTTTLLLKYLDGLLAISAAFWVTKSLLGYKAADTHDLFEGCQRGSVSHGLGAIARAIFFAVILGSFCYMAKAADVHTYIPVQAKVYAPILNAERVRFWGTHPQPEFLAGLIEQESCLSLTHSKCWNPGSRLKTIREEGAGLGQITRAYRTDGSIRFDALTELTSKHSELAGLTWENVYQSPRLQLRAVVLKMQDTYQIVSAIKDPHIRLDFADAAYNGGAGGVHSDRVACGLKKGCNPQFWFGHVELTCTKSKAALYGRTACQINREHVTNLHIRSPKYRGIMS